MFKNFKQPQQRWRCRGLALASLLAAQLALVGVSFAQTTESTLVLFGDSISLGYNSLFPYLDTGNGRLDYGQPSVMLSTILTNSQRPNHVANYGVGGSASGPTNNGNVSNNGVDRISNDLATIKATYPGTNYFALIIYGSNDHGYAISPSTTGFNIGVMVDRADILGYTTLVGTIPPHQSKDVVPVNSSIKATVSAKAAGSANGVYLVDQHASLLPNWFFLNDDGIHPNDAGYMQMAQLWFDQQLQGLIEAIPEPVILTPILSLLLDE